MIVVKLQCCDFLLSQGFKASKLIRTIELNDVTFYHWRSEYDSLKGDQVKRLKSMKMENKRLRRATSDLTSRNSS